MVYKVEDVIRDIKICLDQNMSSEVLAGLGDVDTLSYDEIVRSKIEGAIRQVHNIAPNYLLESGHNFGDSVYWEDQESGYVLLPEDFQRLIVFEMSDWERGVYTAISTDAAEYAKQRSRFKALRGTSQKPVCAIGLRPEGRVLEFYSCKSQDAYVRRGMYVPEPRVDAYGGVDISERCYQAVIYTAASLVLITLGEMEKGTALSQLAEKSLQ